MRGWPRKHALCIPPSPSEIQNLKAGGTKGTSEGERTRSLAVCFQDFSIVPSRGIKVIKSDSKGQSEDVSRALRYLDDTRFNLTQRENI